MFAGKASVKLLNQKGIHTFGDLALTPKERVTALLGKGGEGLWLYANGLDTEPVRKWGDKPEVKSVSHGMTFRRDLFTEEEIRTGVAVRADRIAMSLRRQGLKGSVVSVPVTGGDPAADDSGALYLAAAGDPGYGYEADP